MTAGRFITLEGGEGAGKTSQARLLAQALQLRGYEVVLTREPGGTAEAEAIRALLLSPDTKLTPETEVLLHFAARTEHVERVIRPALCRGAWVVCDRYYDSTMVYQGVGQKAPLGLILALKQYVRLDPDLTLVLNIPATLSVERLKGRGGDRYERLPLCFHQTVSDGFRSIASVFCNRCVLIDASRPIHAVHQEIMQTIEERILPLI